MSVRDEVAIAAPPAPVAPARPSRAARLRRFSLAGTGATPRVGLAVFLLYAVIGLLANPNWPWDSQHLATCACGGNQDLAQTAWFLAWTPYAILHGLNPLLSSWINVPHGVNLADNTSMPLLGVVMAPVTLLFGPVTTDNLLRFASFPLSAYAMYAVSRRLVRFRLAAVLAGLLYGFSPYMVGQASVHLNLGFAPFPPLIFYALYEPLVLQRRSIPRAGALLGALLVAQFYVSPEILSTTAVVAAIAVALLVVVRAPKVPRHALHALGVFAIAAVIVALAIGYPVDLMLHGPQHYRGPSQGKTEVFNADLLGPILPTLDELVAPHRLATIGTNLVGGRADIDENGSYLGIPLIALALYLSLRFWRRWRIAFCVVVAALGFWLSLGPALTIDGVTHKGHFPLPFRLIAHLPLLDDMLPVRFSLYVICFLAFAVAFGLDAYRDAFVARRKRPPAGRVARLRGGLAIGEAALAGLVLVAALVALIPRWPYEERPTDVPVPAGSAALASIPAGSTVLDYPYPEQFVSDAMLWQAVDSMRYRIVGSYILRPGVGQTATALPAELTPLDVQAMFAEPLTPIPLPGEPYLVPTTRTIEARRILLLRGHEVAPGHPAVVGTVENVDLATGAFYLFAPHSLVMTGVTVGPRTLYDVPAALDAPATRVLRAERMAVYGPAIAGTIRPGRVADLRTFLARHRIGAVIVQLQRVDSLNVVRFVTDAIGPPSRRLAGGDLWTSIGRRLAAVHPTRLAAVRPARRPGRTARRRAGAPRARLASTLVLATRAAKVERAAAPRSLR